MSWLSIDFGTSECSAAFVNNDGKPKHIKFSSPNTVTQFDFPTVAWIQEDGKILVGYEANANASKNLSNYVVEFKLDLERADDNIEGINGFTYTDVSAAILTKIKQEAETEKNGNNKFSDVVITVPVDFTETANNRIIAAANRAGFSKVEILHEPKAAAIYFNKETPKVKPDKNEYNALIYDLGGGTFDPAIIHINNAETGMDFSSPISGKGTKKAGKHFDNLIKEKFEALQPYKNNSCRKQINRELKKRCKEDIKCILSGEMRATTSVNYGEEGTKTFTLTRSEFNTMIESAVQESITRCQELIDANNLKWMDIDVIFFVGGSCNIPYVRETVKTYVHKFNSKTQMVWNEFNGCDLQPQYAVSLGAALYKNYLIGIEEAKRKAEVEEKAEEAEDKDKKIENLNLEKSITCKNPNCKSSRCYKIKDRVGYHCLDCGWEGKNVTVTYI